jgi:acid stress-induced BolA-like protein IbaG/YrbA
MLSNEILEQELKALEGVINAFVTGDGHRYVITVVSDVFLDKSAVQRQTWVYQYLQKYISSGDLHALSMHTLTAEEWEKISG